MTPAQVFRIIWRALTPAQRRRFVLLQFVSLLMALSTVAGLAGVMAFLAVLADPTLIESHWALRALARISRASPHDAVLWLGAAFMALLIASAILNVAGSRAMGRFAYSVGDRIREMLFAEYLRRDYLFHARARVGRLVDNVVWQAERVTTTLLQGQQLMTNAVLTVLVVTSIAVVNPQVAAVGVLGIGGAYLLFYLLARRSIGRHGHLQTRLSSERMAVVQQTLLGIKYLLVAGAQPLFRRRLSEVTRPLSLSIAETQFIAQLPRYVLECVAGAALIACAAFVSGDTGDRLWLAQLGFIGFAGFRLLPAFQQMYHALAIVRSNRAGVEHIAAELAGRKPSPESPAQETPAASAFQRDIELAGVSYRYAPDAPLVLDNASLKIAAGEAIGIVGASGCGKTTLVDLLLGLLSPVSGRIDIDGKPLDASWLPAWRKCIGYVPQDVMILDAPIRENIAFGVDPADIDDARLREVARLAGAGEFIEAMPGGYGARLSSVGASLSGGQRQRLGIARALYHDPGLLVLDEATNALDADTEHAIIDAVVRNRGKRTILIVAHGIAVIEACDRVYELRGGTLKERVVSRALHRVAQ